MHLRSGKGQHWLVVITRKRWGERGDCLKGDGATEKRFVRWFSNFYAEGKRIAGIDSRKN